MGEFYRRGAENAERISFNRRITQRFLQRNTEEYKFFFWVDDKRQIPVGEFYRRGAENAERISFNRRITQRYSQRNTEEYKFFFGFEAKGKYRWGEFYRRGAENAEIIQRNTNSIFWGLRQKSKMPENFKEGKGFLLVMQLNSRATMHRGSRKQKFDFVISITVNRLKWTFIK